ncbi:MAG: hypothetical protein JO250_09725 [Armatimonadetes bacterium]|nr:hypothetical protein [Armatimonadota bacterium]
MATALSPHAGTHPVPGTPSDGSLTGAFSQSFTWEEALREFSLHLRATRARKTQRYYAVQLGGLARWASENGVPFAGFGKRHMDRYLAGRADAGRAQLTLHHDAVCAKAFFRWCQKNDLIGRSLLADYEVRTLMRAVRISGTPSETPPSTATATARSCWACWTRRPIGEMCSTQETSGPEGLSGGVTRGRDARY